MANFFDVLAEADVEARQIKDAANGVDCVRLNAIIEACVESRHNGFKTSGKLVKIALDDDADRALSVCIHEYPETTVAGIVAVETHDDGTESGLLLAVGTWSNDQEMMRIYDRGMDRLKLWVAKHGTLGMAGKP